MIYLVAPPIGSEPTGGSLYNHYITSENELVTLLEVTEVNEIENKIDPNAIVIIDSLLLVDYFKSQLHEKYKTIGMIHLPTFFFNESKKNKHELSYYQKIPLLVTGDSFKLNLIQKYNLKAENITTVTPGVLDIIKKKKFNKLVNKIVLVASVTKNKGILEFLNLMKDLSDFPWEIHLYGPKTDLEYYQELQELIVDSNMKERVFFHGYLEHSELLKMLLNYDLFVNFSVYETFGMAIYEALQIGLPVMSYKTNLESTFTKRSNFRNFDTIEAFKNELVELFTEVKTSKKYQAKEEVVPRSWTDVKEDFNAVVKRIII